MRICIPVTEDQGLQSPLSGHFGSAPVFMLVDVESGACRAIPNRNQHHEQGMCQPLQALGAEQIDCVAVAGIGAGALTRLQASNIRVFLSDFPTVEATIAALQSGSLPEMTPAMSCRGHSQGPHGHCHGQGHHPK